MLFGQQVPEALAGEGKVAAMPLFMLVTPTMADLLKHPDPNKSATTETIYVNDDGKRIERN